MTTAVVEVGFTGTRHGMSRRQASRVGRELRVLLHGAAGGVLHHGDAVGADAEAAEIAARLGYRVVAHPPENATLRAYAPSDESREPLPYLARNRAIVDECDVLLAAPIGAEEVRSGTWSTVRYARGAGKAVVVVERGSGE